ncbi:type II toxin-antitoxin system Phd/YefM family antitoxin [Nesterenkonia muleiensis]|uniref:type II toxin-antitoxin system Phd/YefM family antitoxin n=1 Tax=Nesterenkonia muleiensis TaxID=2282648 RepID=UPI00192E3B54|nr:type II toxin-antitoxin system Phd/YefM family antitoxin [Nesterenkonia muleiensis]
MGAEMMNVYEAKSQFSKLLDLAAHGSETIIARSGKPIAKLVPWQPSAQRSPGIWAGKITLSDDFDTFTEQDAQDWYGEA